MLKIMLGGAKKIQVNAYDIDHKYKCAILGFPIQHSKSPHLHLSAYKKIPNFKCLYSKVAISTDSELKKILSNIIYQNVSGAKYYWLGLSITMPLKRKILKYLNKVSKIGKLTKVINTVIVKNSKLIGHNTDVSGIFNSIKFNLEKHNISLSKLHKISILGGGATAISSIVALKFLKINNISFYLRNTKKTSEITRIANILNVNITIHDIEKLKFDLQKINFLISTIPEDSANDLVKLYFKNNKFSKLINYPSILLNVAYNSSNNMLSTFWKNNKGYIISGKEMLLYQAIDQIKLFLYSLNINLGNIIWNDIFKSMCNSIDLNIRKFPEYYVEN